MPLRGVRKTHRNYKKKSMKQKRKKPTRKVRKTKKGRRGSRKTKKRKTKKRKKRRMKGGGAVKVNNEDIFMHIYENHRGDADRISPDGLIAAKYIDLLQEVSELYEAKLPEEDWRFREIKNRLDLFNESSLTNDKIKKALPNFFLKRYKDKYDFYFVVKKEDADRNVKGFELKRMVKKSRWPKPALYYFSKDDKKKKKYETTKDQLLKGEANGLPIDSLYNFSAHDENNKYQGYVNQIGRDENKTVNARLKELFGEDLYIPGDIVETDNSANSDNSANISSLSTP